MERIKIEHPDASREGLEEVFGDVEYSITGLFDGDEYLGYLQFSWAPNGVRRATTLYHDGSDFLYVDKKGSRTVSEEEAGEILGGEKDRFARLRDLLSTDARLSQMLDDIDSFLYK